MKKGERLEKLIRESPYKNVNQIAKATGVPYTTIKSFIERDLERASIDSVVKIAKILGVSVEYLIGEKVEEKQKSTKTFYNYYPTTISAGLPTEVDGITEKEVKRISINDNLLGKWAGKKDIYLMRINGDSMSNIIPDGSLILVHRIDTKQLKNNDIVVYKYDNEYAVKRFIQHDDKLIFRPDSDDPTFTDLVIDLNDNCNDLKIKGKVVLYIVELD